MGVYLDACHTADQGYPQLLTNGSTKYKELGFQSGYAPLAGAWGCPP